MNRPCRAPGCSSPAASSFAAFCSPHRSAFRRHGAPDQRAITKAQLKPYLKLVKARMAKNPDSPAWVTLDERWRALEDIARGIVAASPKGRAGSRYERAAAYEVIKLADDVKPRQVVEVATAMVMMWEMEPRQFRSDRAFWIQLARRVRGVTDMNFGERWDNAAGTGEAVLPRADPEGGVDPRPLVGRDARRWWPASSPAPPSRVGEEGQREPGAA